MPSIGRSVYVKNPIDIATTTNPNPYFKVAHRFKIIFKKKILEMQKYYFLKEILSFIIIGLICLIKSQPISDRNIQESILVILDSRE